MIMTIDHINGSMHLNAANFGSHQILANIDVVDVVFFNQGEDTAQVTNNPRLTTVMNAIAPHDMRANMFFVPAFIRCLTDHVTFRLRTIFVFPLRPFIVIVWLQVLAKRDTRTFGMRNLTFFNDPSF